MGERRPQNARRLDRSRRIGRALGLILPQALTIAPLLTPIAAAGLAAIVLLGAFFHLARKEYREIGVNVIFFILTVVIAIGRF
ncbi:DoxX family protein [Paenibacillus albicereus]|uniref:DoxX family protein n=1 Tax=Paenibacillus albicereus TaxID=2726185 RepID=UPI001F22DC1F|nr:DoxX family protein [Paenibacillus albicereus]